MMSERIPVGGRTPGLPTCGVPASDIPAGRISRFMLIGVLGFIVQMLVATALLTAGLQPVLATVLAIEAAIVNNHVWHRRWAWRGRAAAPWPVTLLRAHVGAGGASLVVGGLVVAGLTGRVPPLLAQVIAVAICAASNYWIADRWIFRRAVPAMALALTLGLALPAPARADGPSAAAQRSWERYAAALQALRLADRGRSTPSWATDTDPGGERTVVALRRGDAVVTRRSLPGIDVDDATLEHWQGSVLLRGVSLDRVLYRLRHPEAFAQPTDVLKLAVTAHTDRGHDLYLRVTRSMLVTATYDTWHRVQHERVGADRIESHSISTRVDEVDDAGTATERRLAAHQSRGFLWRMQSWWRFTAVPDGVIVTCESITLSRPVPFGLGLVSRPIITRVARESMTTAVRAWQRW